MLFHQENKSSGSVAHQQTAARKGVCDSRIQRLAIADCANRLNGGC
jgi:hypothetical protein